MFVKYLSRYAVLVSLLILPAAYAASEQAQSNNSNANQPTFAASVYFGDQAAKWRLQAEGPVRLSAAVTSALQQVSPPLSTLAVDWQRARLHKLSTSAHPLTETKLALWQAVEQQVADNQRYAWRSLYEQLQQQEFAERAWVNLDPDFTRVVEGNNPLLSGDYVLYLPSLQTKGSVMVWGAVSHPGTLAWQARISAKQYAQQARWLNSRLSHVSVIQPNGEVEQHPVGYWLAHSFSVQPGSIIYVPFTSASFAATTTAQLDELNQWVIETLRHRLPTNTF